MRRMMLIGLCVTTMKIVTAQAQTTDSSHITYLPDVTIVGRNSRSDYQQMPEIVGTNIYAGKKNALIVLDNVQGNVVSNNMRQVLSKVAGIHIWESDPSGIQIGIAARGLSPNRSWEFNTRQNGYDISADPFGYPEAYYNPQLQAVQRIEIVRGQGSLQYGPQFGGMVNYILRNGSELSKPLEFETQQTVGSNGLFNTYNAVGGKKGNVHYYAFFDHRNGDGWRANSRYYSNAAFGTVTFSISSKFKLTAEVMQSHIRSQQPGGLTDQQFADDARQSFRSRNWFDIKWTTPALIANIQFSSRTRLNTKFFATIGDRNSVGFLQSVLINDSINASTLQYNGRVVNIDQYRNYGMESRLLTEYKIGKAKHSLSAGIRLYTGNTFRRAEGKGTNGTNYTVAVTGNYPKSINFGSQNAAAFIENVFRIGKRLLVIPGVRYEWLSGDAMGRNGYNAAGDEILLQNIKRSRSFLLGGLGLEYHVSKSTEVYANYSQAYRPIQFANLQAPPSTDVVDPDLKDARGYNADVGYRGKFKNFLQFDVSVFYLQYKNRIGNITPQGAGYRLVTNVGASTSKGIESFAEWNVLKTFTQRTKAFLSVFASYSFNHSRYSGDHKDGNTKGKKVENAPASIVRSGISAGYKDILLTWQFSYVDKTYSDANNTEKPTANGQTGLIPSYALSDLSFSWKYNKHFQLKAGINNVFDKNYFTRRAGGYPGPGLLPGDGRTFFVSVGAKF